MPRVSVIVPNFNHARFLERRLDSILEQSFKDFEIIILDDCSQDDSRSVIERYRQRPEVSGIIYGNACSGSPFKQWKKGIELAAGELIWIAESDDFCDRSLLDTLVRPFDIDPGCVLSFCRSLAVDVEGNEIGIFWLQRQMDNSFSESGKTFVSRWLSQHNYVANASSAVFKRSAAMDVSDRFLSYKGLGDLVFWIEISLQGNVSYCHQALNMYRQHAGSQTAKLRDTPVASTEILNFNSFLTSIGVHSYFALLKYRISLIYRVRYVYNFTGAQKAEVLRVAHDNPMIDILAFLKLIKRRGK